MIYDKLIRRIGKMIYGFDDNKNKVEFIKKFEQEVGTDGTGFTITPSDLNGDDVSNWDVISAYYVVPRGQGTRDVYNANYIRSKNPGSTSMYIEVDRSNEGLWVGVILAKTGETSTSTTSGLSTAFDME